MNRVIARTAIALAALTSLAGCTGETSGADVSALSSTASSDPATTVAVCTSETAKSARQVLLSTNGFDATCVRTPVGKQFFFINDSDSAQSLKTSPGAPEAFEVDLPKKTSTYVRAFKKKGTYVIQQVGGGVPLTLVIT